MWSWCQYLQWGPGARVVGKSPRFGLLVKGGPQRRACIDNHRKRSHTSLKLPEKNFLCCQTGDPSGPTGGCPPCLYTTVCNTTQC